MGYNAENLKQGYYEVINTDKYRGDVKKVRYLSSWEYDICVYFDKNPNVLEWNSEDIVIPYYSPADKKKRRYMVDFWVKYKDRNGNIKQELVECKPYAQTQPPTKRGRKSKTTLLNEQYTYQVNVAKWTAAAEFAKKRGMTFRIITENDIYR